MTTIVAVVREGVTVMAADTTGTDGCGRRYPDIGKIARKPVGRDGDALIGAAGRAALLPLVRFDLNLPIGPDPADEDDCNLWAQRVAEALTALMVDMKPALTDDDGNVDGGGLLAYAGRLWILQENWAYRATRGWAAIGSGDDFATGALELLQEVGAEEAATVAVSVACRHDAATAPPIEVQVA